VLPPQGLSEILDFPSGITGWALAPVDDILYIKIPDTGRSQSIRVEIGPW